MPPRPDAPGLRAAALIGLVHGPAELLPVSSSAHVRLLAPGAPHNFAVALHAGTAAGLARLPEAPLGAVAASMAAPVVLGGLFAGAVERRAGTPHGIAAGLAVGTAAMLAADRRPAVRSVASATARDGFWLGLAQATAILPGVSRSGATLAAARARGFTRPAAWTLARDTGTPVVVGAAALTGLRAVRAGIAPRQRLVLAVGAAAAWASGAAAARHAPARLPLAPFAVYRLALAAVLASRVGKR